MVNTRSGKSEIDLHNCNHNQKQDNKRNLQFANMNTFYTLHNSTQNYRFKHNRMAQGSSK